jgi:putative proteasome-type protease
VIAYEASLAGAAKCALLSFDATMRSNLSVAPPVDLPCYREGSLCAETRVDIAEDDPYFGRLRADYSRGILELFKRLPDPDWIDLAVGDLHQSIQPAEISPGAPPVPD